MCNLYFPNYDFDFGNDYISAREKPLLLQKKFENRENKLDVKPASVL
jgi:hypothetical protein